MRQEKVLEPHMEYFAFWEVRQLVLLQTLTVPHARTRL